MQSSFWDVLGIAETMDERAIKRAYAARLRITSPESDVAGYMQLRDAYEAAKRQASFQREYGVSDEIPEDESLEMVDLPQAPAAPVDSLPLSPQSQVFAELQALLSQHRLDDFLRKIEAVQASQTFATLDEQHDFIGEIAWLVQQAGVEDSPWRGRLASLLGAREHDNIFSQHSRYWFAYESLLRSYAELRDAATHAHAGTQDEVAATPGYLHVYHVLTAPFDSERLSALTRSRTYHRLAENILERSKNDPAIVIPAENREWWERTAMAGQHRPAEDPPAAKPAPPDKSWGFPTWPIYIVLMLLFNSIRMCGDQSTSRTVSQDQLKRYQELVQPAESALMRRMALCDPQTRVVIYSHIYQARGKFESANTSGAEKPDPLSPRLKVDENDPVIASLLETCKPPQPR